MNQGRRSGDQQRLAEKVGALLGATHVTMTPVAGNWGLTIHRAQTSAGTVAVKAGKPRLQGHLETEARMLADLHNEGLPVPKVLAVTSDVLITEWIEHDQAPLRPIHERAAARALAALHAIRRGGFGYSYPTQFGALAQPNDETGNWTGFFRDQRLLFYAALALERGLINAAFNARIERLADRLSGLIEEPSHASLLHGDVWSGNILTRGPKLCAFVDPALFAGHLEYELAYVTMHGTFGRAFFEAYQDICPISPDFAPLRLDIYLIVPLLQHALLSGPAYIYRIDRTLKRLGI